VPDPGLDVEKLSLLGQWAEGLQRDPRGEVAAAGKAILMLIEEVERLHVTVWDGLLNPGKKSELELASREAELEDFPSLLDRLRRRLTTPRPPKRRNSTHHPS
jgi:hypothetical protein